MIFACRALAALALLSTAGCFEITFTEPGSGGGGASGSTTVSSQSSTSDGGAGSTTTGCEPKCDLDHRCGDDGCRGLCNDTDIPEQLFIDFDRPARDLVLDESTQSAYIALGSGPLAIARIDLCDGSTMSTQDLSSGTKVAAMGIVGDHLFVAVEDMTPYVRRFELDDLEKPSPEETEVLPFHTSGITMGASDGTALWVQARFVDDGLNPTWTSRMSASFELCNTGPASTPHYGRGFVIQDGKLLDFVGDNPGGSGTYRYVGTPAACGADWGWAATGDGLGSLTGDARAIAGGAQAYLIGSQPSTGHPGVIERYSFPAGDYLGQSVTDPNPATDTDYNFLERGQMIEDELFVGGVASGSADFVQGKGWLSKLPSDLSKADSVILDQVIEIQGLAGDATGVYTTGRRGPMVAANDPTARGFFMKCTRSLECPTKLQR